MKVLLGNQFQVQKMQHSKECSSNAKFNQMCIGHEMRIFQTPAWLQHWSGVCVIFYFLSCYMWPEGPWQWLWQLLPKQQWTLYTIPFPDPNHSRLYWSTLISYFPSLPWRCVCIVFYLLSHCMQPEGLWQWVCHFLNNGSELLQSSHGGVYEEIIAFGMTNIPWEVLYC